MDMLSLLGRAPVIPVIVIDDTALALALAHALIEGGIFALEVTLRTPSALRVIEHLRAKIPEAFVGAGTVKEGTQLAKAQEAGAQFIMTPGLTPDLASAALQCQVPFIPGVATPSEAMYAAKAGFLIQKFFPAASFGAERWLAAMAGPYPELRFCPTGGIDATNAKNYLALPNVLAIGCSSLIPQEALVSRDWKRITALARAASQWR